MGLKERFIQSQKEAGLSNYKLAKILGISKSTIANYQSGSTIPTGPYLNAIAKAFGINREWLATGKGEKIINSNNPNFKNDIDIISDSKKLKMIIKHLDLNQTEFAKSIGYEADSINKIINGHADISKDIAKAIAIKYRINLNWLLIGSDEMLIDYPRLKELKARCQRYEGIIDTLTKSTALLENKEENQSDTEEILKRLEQKCEEILTCTINENFGKVDDWMEKIERKF